MKHFCAYIQARPNTIDAHGIFYVGKGTHARAQSLKARNPHHGNIVAKYGAENILVGMMTCSSEATAFDLERGLIKCLRRMRVKLTNMTDGGEGVSGLQHSQESKLKMSVSQLRANNNPTLKAKRSNSQLTRLAKPGELEKLKTAISAGWNKVGAKLQQSLRTKKHFESKEARQNTSISTKQAMARPEVRDGCRMRVLGKIWVNNGVVTKHVRPGEIPNGFTRGRLRSLPAPLTSPKET